MYLTFKEYADELEELVVIKKERGSPLGCKNIATTWEEKHILGLIDKSCLNDRA